jgi:quercetin dioxygenase-like cupin family protein
MKTIRISAVAVLMAAGVLALQGIQAQQAEARRTELQRHDLSVPGRELIQVRVEIPPGSVFPSHTHPGEEVIYVIEGAWNTRSVANR